MIKILRANVHEFKNKLHVILGLIQLNEIEEAKKYILEAKEIQENTSEKFIMIDDYYVKAMLVSRDLIAKEKNIIFNITEDSYLYQNHCQINSNELVTVIGNLIDNAYESFDYTKENVKEVIVKLREDNNRVFIEVEDNGNPISGVIKNNIFERGVSSKGINRGIGLFLVKNKIDLYNGTFNIVENINSKKFIITLVPIFFIILLFFGAFYFGLIDLSDEEKNDENTSKFRINQFTTAKKIYGYNNININDSFERDETFYFYMEFKDISLTDNNNKCNLEIKLTIKSNNNIIDNIFLKISEIKNYYNISITPDSTWPIGNYEVKIIVIDKISQTSLEDTIIFNLSEKSLKITKLLPASYVGGFNNYIYSYSFTLSDTVYIYQEYDGFQINNYGNCDITMEITINVSGSTIYSKSYNEDNGNVKMHKWDILIDNNWLIDVYIVNVTIKDNLSGINTSKSISFRVL